MEFVRRNKANGWRYFQPHFSQWWNCGNDDYHSFNFSDRTKYAFLNPIKFSSKAFDYDEIFYRLKFLRNFLFLRKKLQWLAVICSCSPSKLWYLWWMSSCNCQYQFATRKERKENATQCENKTCLEENYNWINVGPWAVHWNIKAWLKLVHKVVELMRAFMEPIYPPESHPYCHSTLCSWPACACWGNSILLKRLHSFIVCAWSL